MLTPRSIDPTGKNFCDIKDLQKNRELFTQPWNAISRKFLDAYFAEKGLDIKCDAYGIIPQNHLGPKRHHQRAFDLIIENMERIELNAELAKDPKEVLEAVSKHKKHLHN